jgi:glycosyltransferase-like protein
MLSVGVFTYSTKPRGSVVHAMALTEALVAAGHDATLYALCKPGAQLHRPLACPLVLLPATAAPADPDALIQQRIGEFVDGCERLARRHDVVHAQDCLAANALLALRGRGTGSGSIVRTVHHVERFESPYLTDCQRRSIADADALFSVSRLTRDAVLAEFGRRSHLVHNGVDATRFEIPRPDVEARLRARYGIEPGDTVVLSVGGVEPRKNTLVALQAVAAAAARAPSERLRWIVVGDHSIWDHSVYGALFDAELARTPALHGRVVRAGTLPEDELTSLYTLADLLLCPSREEGFGLCVLEAMAAGTPVVVPARAPFTEYLDDRCSALVDAARVAPIADAIVDLATEPRRRHTLATAARARCAEFSWVRSAALHLTHYRTIRATHPGPRPSFDGDRPHA